jgi:hypothetical protein
MNTCKTCGNQFEGKYCNLCGERLYNEKDKTLYHFFEDAIHFLTHLDGTLLNTLKAMFTRPGLLSVDYCNGIRRKYFKPLSLFLILVVIYLLFPLFQGLDMSLFNNTHIWYGQFATQKATAIMHEKSLSFGQLSNLYHEKSEKVSKFLLIILIPVMALFFWLFFHKKKKYLFDHLVFSTEINSFFLLWGFLILPLLLAGINSIVYFFSKTYLFDNELGIGIMIFTVFGIYTGVAVRRFYKIKKWQAIIFASLFIAFHIFFVLWVYKFILFVITIYQF